MGEKEAPERVPDKGGELRSIKFELPAISENAKPKVDTISKTPVKPIAKHTVRNTQIHT